MRSTRAFHGLFVVYRGQTNWVVMPWASRVGDLPTGIGGNMYVASGIFTNNVGIHGTFFCVFWLFVSTITHTLLM